MSTKKSSRIVIIIVIFVITTLGFQLWWMFSGLGTTLFGDLQDRVISPIPSWSSAITSYDINSTYPQFQELWTSSDVYLLSDPGRECNLAASNDRLLFVGSFAQNEQQTFNRVNLKTGEIDWKTALTTAEPAIMADNPDSIFLGSGIPGNITSFDAETGAQKWTYSLPMREKNIIYYMNADETNLFVNSSSRNFYIFEAKTGQPQIWESKFAAFPIFYLDENVIYHLEIDTHLIAANRFSGQVNWETSFDEPIFMKPIIVDDLLVVKTGKSNIGQVYALERFTGETLWQYPPGKINWESSENIIGNVAVGDGFIFYLTVGGQLKALDARTGKLMGTVQFVPSFQELDVIEHVNREFCVTTSNNVVVVYLGSSRQIFAFNFSPIN